MKKFSLALFLSLVFPASVLVTSALFASAETSPEVTLTELKGLVAKKSATIVDVNSAKSYKEGHIPGAIHFGANEKNFAKVLPADKNALIVAYCGGPMCTAWEDAAEAAKKLGYTNVKHFKGGIKGWKDAKEKTEKGA